MGTMSTLVSGSAVPSGEIVQQLAEAEASTTQCDLVSSTPMVGVRPITQTSGELESLGRGGGDGATCKGGVEARDPVVMSELVERGQPVPAPTAG